MENEAKQALRERCEKVNAERGEDVEFYFDPDANLTPADETHVALRQVDRDWPLMWVPPTLVSVEFLRVADGLFAKGFSAGRQAGASAKAREIRKALGIDEEIARASERVGA